MRLGVACYRGPVATANRAIVRCSAPAAHGTSSLGSSARITPRVVSGKTFGAATYVAESSIVTYVASTVRAVPTPLPPGVTKLAGPPSKLDSELHLDFWRPDPGQLPMDSVSCEKGILPRMQRNKSCCLITTASAAPQQRAVNGPLRGMF
jgi:hypothetical protein